MDMMLYVPQGLLPPHHDFMHPLNALRNRAIAAAQTEVSKEVQCLLFVGPNGWTGMQLDNMDTCITKRGDGWSLPLL